MEAVNVMEYWQPDDDSHADRETGVHNIGPAIQRALSDQSKKAGVAGS